MLHRTKGWPVTLDEGDVQLRPLRRSDRDVWLHLRETNQRWLQPWEPTMPAGSAVTESFLVKVRELNRRAKKGEALPFAIEYRGQMVGQITFAPLNYGPARHATVGYWMSEHVASRGIMTTALALGVDYCMRELALHRVEANIRPENGPSRRVVEKLGFRNEGLRERYLHINGAWRDHLCFTVTSEDVPQGLLARVRRYT